MTYLRLSLIAPFLLLASCASYRAPTSGPTATLTCEQPKYANLLALPGNPVIQVRSIDGRTIGSPVYETRRTVTVAAGLRTIRASAHEGALNSDAILHADFKSGGAYTIAAKSDGPSHRYEIRDSAKRLVKSQLASDFYSRPQPIYIPLPVN